MKTIVTRHSSLIAIFPVFLISLLIFSGCASFQQDIQQAGKTVQQVVGPPSQVQIDISNASAIAKQFIPAADQAKIHDFATSLASAANLDLTGLFALLPNPGRSVTANLLLTALKTTLTLVVQQLGSHNATALAYAHAIANGLLANF